MNRLGEDADYSRAPDTCSRVIPSATARFLAMSAMTVKLRHTMPR